MLKKVLKIILIVAAVSAAVLFVLYGIFIYVLNYMVHTVDRQESPDGQYSILLQSVGSPVFFSAADGRLVLREGKKVIVKYDFSLYDDGGSIRPSVWQVDWEEDQVVVILSGAEQDDMQITLGFDGAADSKSVSSERDEDNMQQEDSAAGDETEEGTDGNGAAGGGSHYYMQGDGGRDESMDPGTGSLQGSDDLSEYYQKIRDGYMAVYDRIFREQDDSFFESYDAKGNLRIILHEDDRKVEYLMYDRESENGKCGLYVYYSVQKNEDGSWSPADARILDMYAWVYDSGAVISSGKTAWADPGTEEYREATGE